MSRDSQVDASLAGELLRQRQVPQSVEAERALLGGLIVAPERYGDVADVVRAEEFYRPDHAALYTLIGEMSRDGATIDAVSLGERIARDDPERYGGMAYVLSLPEAVPSTAALENYADIVFQKATLRAFVRATLELTSEALDQPDDLQRFFDHATRQITAIKRDGARGWEDLSLVVDAEIQRLEALSQSGGDLVGVTTGFTDLDARLAGMQRSDLLILAARPSMGKTALALNIARSAAMVGGVAVAVFSLEMSRGQLVGRLLSSMAEIDASRMRLGHLVEDEWEALLAASDDLRGARIFLDDTPGLSIGDLRARARRLSAQASDLGLIVIDYLQLMQGDDPKAPRIQQIGDISRGLKALAKDLNVPVLALSQLNRGVEARADKRPMMSDLRESGAIEQDADVIMFIYRDEYYNPESPDKGLAEVIIAKQRNGPTGMVKLVFTGRYARFDDHYAGPG